MGKIAVVQCGTKNIGDDMQTLAALQFAPDAEFVTRDKIGKETRDLKIIGNGWWMEGDSYPREDQDILPISMHIAEKTGTNMYKWLKSKEPIGCRDTWTMKRLQKAGIAAYFSGCLTLTFPYYRGKREGVVYVDRIPDKWKVTEGTYLSHRNPQGDKQSVEERLKLAQEHLNIYKTASLVITKRLHVALPCLAMGTPVLVNDKVWASERFSGYSLPNEYKGLDADYKIVRPAKLINELKKRVQEYVK
jgi:hypothetical protein